MTDFDNITTNAHLKKKKEGGGEPAKYKPWGDSPGQTLSKPFEFFFREMYQSVKWSFLREFHDLLALAAILTHEITASGCFFSTPQWLTELFAKPQIRPDWCADSNLNLLF